MVKENLRKLGICQLCGKKSELELSHILPSFVFKWLKKTSATGGIRDGKDPNIRLQDGLKEYFLCEKCEDTFNEWETKFANQVFHPMHQNKINEPIYEEWLMKFAVSISWRVLAYNAFIKEPTFPEQFNLEIKLALKTWGNFLLGNAKHPGSFEQHIFQLGTIAEPRNDMPTSINRYFQRAIDEGVAYSENSKEWLYTYSKLGKIVIIGFVKMSHRHLWKGTKINLKQGQLWVTKEYFLPDYLKDCLYERALHAEKTSLQLSDRQIKKLDTRILKDKNKALKSASYRAYLEDVNAFEIDNIKKS